MRGLETSSAKPLKTSSAGRRTVDRLDGQTAVVTGAARGIGRAIALRLAAAGAGVVAADLEAPRETAAAANRTRNGRCLAVAADVSDRAQVGAMVQASVREFGALDILVPNAAIGFPDPILTMTEENWDRVLAVNLKGAFLCVQAALPALLERKGSMVLISSIAGRRSSLVNGAHYTCSKYGLIGLTRHLAVELAGTGVRVNCVCPGPVETPLLTRYTTAEERSAMERRTPLHRIGEPGDVAEVVAFVAGPGARHMHGAIVDVNGGLY
jgi:NAD(P)-dependent dehydrogenase (short-subunit alcohol dehydrogenase family)